MQVDLIIQGLIFSAPPYELTSVVEERVPAPKVRLPPTRSFTIKNFAANLTELQGILIYKQYESRKLFSLLTLYHQDILGQRSRPLY